MQSLTCDGYYSRFAEQKDPSFRISHTSLPNFHADKLAPSLYHCCHLQPYYYMHNSVLKLCKISFQRLHLKLCTQFESQSCFAKQ